MVPRGTSASPGRWKTRYYQRAVLDSICDPLNTEGTLFVAAAQLAGKTEIALNAMGYLIASDPSPQILVTYSVEMAQRLSKHRVASMIRESQTLKALVSEARSRDSGNTILDKEYPGGQLTLVGANSAGGLSMAPKRAALFDEIDRYPASAGLEGDPVELAKRRLASYWNRIQLYVTSPGTKDVSRSWRLWQQSDQREWHVACPDCGGRQTLKWGHVHWDKDGEGNHLPETAIYACELCGSAWDDISRWRASEAGGYEPTSKFDGLAGFRISALAIANVPLEEIVRQWLRAQGNPEEIKVFKTTVLAEWWDDEYAAGVDEAGLLARREPMAERDGRIEIPAACGLLTAGVDVQDNRFEISVYAWAQGEESWCLGHEVIWGDPSTLVTWEALDLFLLSPWPRAAGGVDYLRGVCIDTGGHHTQAAYEFCGARFRRPTPDGGLAYTFAVKGQAGKGDLWPRRPSKATKKTPLWPILVDVGKAQIYGRLGIRADGPGRVHFPETLDRDFFDGLVSERILRTTHRRSGRPVDRWVLKRPGARNEQLDCAVMAYAALCGLRAMGVDLEAEIAALSQRAAPPPEPKPAQATAAETPQPAARRSEAPVDSGWLGDTRDWLGR